METWAIVVAAGGSTRFGRPKQYADLAGRRVLDWSVESARAACDGVVVVLPAADAGPGVPGADAVVAGGLTRSDSVRAGLSAVPAGAGIIVIHDAARPLARPELWSAVIAGITAGADAAIPGVAGHRHDQAGHRRTGLSRRWTAASWSRCRPHRPSGHRPCAPPTTASASPPTTPP